MCRIFYAFGLSKANLFKKTLFFLQQTHTKKNTPGLDNPHDSDTHEDGFGFASFSDKWTIWKSIHPYYHEEDIDKIIKRITSNSDVLIGHIRNADISPVKYENTHPFIYKNYVFVHNGTLRYIDKSGQEKKTFHPTIEKMIDQTYRPEIKGDTDSERMFFLLLTEYKSSKSWKTSILRLFSVLNKYHSKYTSNFIFACKKYTIITRVSYNVPCLSLYWNNPHEGFVISSEPVYTKSQLIPENTCYIIDHNSKQIVERFII